MKNSNAVNEKSNNDIENIVIIKPSGDLINNKINPLILTRDEIASPKNNKNLMQKITTFKIELLKQIKAKVKELKIDKCDDKMQRLYVNSTVNNAIRSIKNRSEVNVMFSHTDLKFFTISTIAADKIEENEKGNIVIIKPSGDLINNKIDPLVLTRDEIASYKKNNNTALMQKITTFKIELLKQVAAKVEKLEIDKCDDKMQKLYVNSIFDNAMKLANNRSEIKVNLSPKELKFFTISTIAADKIEENEKGNIVIIKPSGDLINNKIDPLVLTRDEIASYKKNNNTALMQKITTFKAKVLKQITNKVKELKIDKCDDKMQKLYVNSIFDNAMKLTNNRREVKVNLSPKELKFFTISTIAADKIEENEKNEKDNNPKKAIIKSKITDNRALLPVLQRRSKADREMYKRSHANQNNINIR